LFGRDLRLADHAGLSAAARLGAIVPALVLDDAAERRLARNARRRSYFAQAVTSLARDLEARGTQLVVRRGKSRAREVIRLAREAGVTAVVWSAAYDASAQGEQRTLQSALEEAGLRVVIVHDAPAVAPEETAGARSDDAGLGYRAFVPYFVAWNAQPRAVLAATAHFARHALVSASLPAGDGPAIALDATAGASESAALHALARYVAGPVLQYPVARNVPAGAPTSRLSAALSFGLISARTVLGALDERARDPFLLAEERVALRAFVRALAQRDFFLQLAWFFEDKADRALQPRMRGFRFADDHPALAAWRTGSTGFTLVDAGIRQLRATGWMHPRVRLIAASFLCFDLGVDWRVGRDAWEEELLEDDFALATGNWQWVAGVGADLAQFPRIYNPAKQARAFDASGTYARTWIPELANVPGHLALEPARATARRQLALPLFDGAQYPAPVVDHEQAARHFLQRYASFRQAGLTR